MKRRLMFLVGLMLLSSISSTETSIFIDTSVTSCAPQTEIPNYANCPDLESALNYCKEKGFNICVISAFGELLPDEKNSGIVVNGDDYPALDSLVFNELNSFQTVSSSFFLQIHNATFNITLQLLNMNMQYSGFPCLYIHNINPQSVIEVQNVIIQNVDSANSAVVIDSPGTIVLSSIEITDSITRNDCGALQLRTYDTTVLYNPFTISQITLSNITTTNGGLCILGGGHLSFYSVFFSGGSTTVNGRAIYIDGPGDFTFTYVSSTANNHMSLNGRFLYAVNFNNLTMVNVSVLLSNYAGDETISEGGLLYIDTTHNRSRASFHQIALTGTHFVAQKGGLIYARNLKELTLKDAVLSGGNAITGGAILLDNIGTFSAVNVNFRDCYATTGSVIACCNNSTNTYMSNVTAISNTLFNPEIVSSAFYSDGSCASPFWTSGTTTDSCASCNSTVCSNGESTAIVCYCDGYNCNQVVPPSTNISHSSDYSELPQSPDISGFDVFLITIGCIAFLVIVVLITVAGYFVYKRKTNSVTFEKVSAE